MNKSWYLLRYHYGQANRAIANLERLGVNCFSPQVKKYSSGKKKLNTAEGGHLFPPYVFVEFNPEEIHFSSLQYTPGVCGFVRFGQALKEVPVKVINMLLTSEETKKNNDKINMHSLIQCKDKHLRSVMFLSMMEKIIVDGASVIFHTLT